MYEKYLELLEQKQKIEADIALLKDDVIQQLKYKDNGTAKLNEGTLYIVSRKTWKYSPETEKMKADVDKQIKKLKDAIKEIEEPLSDKKKIEEKEGIAEVESVQETVAFKPIKKQAEPKFISVY